MTPRQTTPDRIDQQYRANHHPDDARLDAIATALDGRRLNEPALMQDVYPECRRCRQKNQKRRMAGVDPVDDQLDDGDDVVLTAVYVDDGMTKRHWRITSLHHAEHCQLPFADIVEAGTALVRARATIHRTPHATHVVSVDLKDRSRTDDGPDQSVVSERRQQYVDDSDIHPDDMTVISPDPEDPPADWTDKDRRWLDGLIEDHGPLNLPKYTLGAE